MSRSRMRSPHFPLTLYMTSLITIAGYADDAPLGLHSTTSILSFIESKDPVEHLASWNAYKWEGAHSFYRCQPSSPYRHRILHSLSIPTTTTTMKLLTLHLAFAGDKELLEVVDSHAATTADVKHMVDDLKVLSKTDFKQLLKWRTKIIEALKNIHPDGEASDDDDEESSEEELTPEELKQREEEALQNEVEEFKEEMDARKRRKLKKERELKAKMQRRVDMGMEVGRLADRDALEDAAQQEGLFQLGQIHTDKEGIDELQAGAYAELSEEEEADEEDRGPLGELEYEAEQEAWLEEAHKAYLTRRKQKGQACL